jgi:hypothetical protein
MYIIITRGAMFSASVLLLLLIGLVKRSSNQESLLQDQSPKIDFINIRAGSPTITITFKVPSLTFETPLTNFWLKFEVPFSTTSLGPPIWGSTTTCCDYANMVFSSTTESYQGTVNNVSTIYVRLTGSTFDNKMTYVLQFVPDTWLTYAGYTEYMRLSMVSEASTDAITYAYNYAFMSFYASDVASNNLLLQDATVDNNRFAVNKVVDSYLIIQVGYSTAQRVIVQTTGAYTFTSNANTTCGTVADVARGISAQDPAKVSCEFWESLGPKKRQSLVFIWKSGYIPPGTYKLKYQLNTPSTAGDHHLTILTMARFYPYIYLKKEYKSIFSAVSDSWETGFPKLYYASGYNANNQQLIDQIGLFSMGLNYHKAFNSLQFIVRANTILTPLTAGQKYSLDIYIGDANAILPLGYVYENLPLAPGFTAKNITFIKGVLTVDNIDFPINQAFTVTFRVGFRTQGALPTDTDRGFGTCVLRKGTTIILRQRANMRSRFNVVAFNPSLMTVESVDRSDNFKRRHRGFSAVRSAPAAQLASPINYQVSTSKNGLRIGTGQNLWFQSSIGPNPLYYPVALQNTHNGNRLFLDLIVDKSITGSTGVVYSDATAASNCDVHMNLYGQWASSVTPATAQAIVTAKYSPPAITISGMVTPANFIGGCEITTQVKGGDTFTRMRMRFKDYAYQDTNNIQQYLRAKDIVLVDSNEVKTTNGALGNYFVWKGVTVSKFQNFKFINTDAVILDAFMQMYMYGGTETTAANLAFPPEVASLDNMYVLADDDINLPLSLSFFATVQHIWMYDSDPSASKWSVAVHDSTKWPVVLHFFGTFATLPTNTRYLVIFFDFFDILVADNSTNTVGCTVNGVVVQKCIAGGGYSQLDEQIYQTITNNAGYSYITSRLSNYLLLDILPTDAANFGGKTFSIVLPVKPIWGSSLSKLATLYENQAVLNPAIMAVDQYWQVLDFVEFGTGIKSMMIDTKAFNTAYEIPLLINSYELSTANIQGLDDVTLNNNPNNALWIDPTASYTIGALADGNIKSICTTCQPYALTTNMELFSTGLICGNWDLGQDVTFAVNYNAVNNQLRPSKIKYLNPDGTLRYCLYLPSLLNSASVADVNIKSYPIQKLFVPNYSGIKWPSDMITVVSSSKVLGFMKPQSLQRTFNPNAITFLAGDNTLNLIQTYNSAKVKFNFQMSNPLPKGSVLFFGITAGCESLLTIYGDDGTPPCTIQNNVAKDDNSGKLMDCIYSINTGGFQIELAADLPINGAITTNNVAVIIYGLSIKSAIQSNTCSFVLRSYLSLSKNPLLMIDSSTNTLDVTYTLPVDAANPSGKVKIESSTSDNNQVTAYSNVWYTLNVTERPIYQTDYLSLSLGALNYDTTDNPVWCAVLDSTTNNYLTDFTKCLTSNLGQINLKAYKDLTSSNLKVQISNIINPITKTPGASAEYYINEGFKIFNSAAVNWNNIINYDKFLNPVRAWVEFDVQGLRSDIFISFIPDHPVNITNVIYLYFSSHYLPTLSDYQVYVYMSYLAPSAKSKTEFTKMLIWNLSPRMLAITGWTEIIPASSNITLKIIGVSNPVSSKNRVFQVTLGFEKQYSVFSQWGYTTLPPGPTLSPIQLINLNSLVYDSLVIRQNTKITVGFSPSKDIPAGSYVLVTLNYLQDEIVKQFKPFCFMTKSTEFVSIASNCYMVGNRLEAQLTVGISSSFSYTFIMDDVPNPDFGYKEPEPIIIAIVDKKRVSVLSVSTEMIINYERSAFVKLDTNQLLDFSSISSGIITVPQGFYAVVKISPIVVDALKDSSFYLDTVTFALGDVGKAPIKSKVLSILGIKKFQASIGGSSANLIVGASKNTVLSTYPVQITKKEASGQIYSELPLLRIEVVPVTYTLSGLTTIDMNIGSRSIPIKLSISNVPVDDIKFDILFLSGDAGGKLTVANNQQQFILSDSKLAFFLQLEAYDKTITPQTVAVTIRAVLSSSNFLDKVIAVNLVAGSISSEPTVTFTVPTLSPNYFNITFQAQSDQPVFIYYYAVPSYLFVNQTKDTVRSWALNGIDIIEGDISVGSLGIMAVGVAQTIAMTNLIADTSYTLMIFIESTTSTTVKTMNYTFNTKALQSKNGIMSFTFSQPALYTSRIKVLCIVAKKYSLTLENLYSGQALNCDGQYMPSYVTDYHKANEVEPLTAEVNTSISSMDVLAFQSKREGENSQGLSSLIAASSLPGALNVFSLYLNGVVRLNLMTAMGNFFETKPTLSGSPSVATDWNKANVTGVSFTGAKGFVFAVAQKAEEMADTLTTAEIRNLTKFNAYFWMPLGSSPAEISVKFVNLTENTNYKMALVATSDDPRSGAASSEILYTTFKTPEKPKLAFIMNILCFIVLLYPMLFN